MKESEPSIRTFCPHNNIKAGQEVTCPAFGKKGILQKISQSNAKDDAEDNGQTDNNCHDDQLSLCPVPEGIFLLGVAHPDEQHDQVDDTANQRNEGNQRTTDPATDRNGLFGSGSNGINGAIGGIGSGNAGTAVGAEGSAVVKGSAAVVTNFHNFYLFSEYKAEIVDELILS